MSDLASICRELAGRVPGAVASSEGGLRFSRRGFGATVDFVGSNTDVQYDVGNLVKDTLQVATGGLWHDLRNMFGFPDFQIGDADFDRDYYVRAENGEFAAKLLPAPIRSVMRQFAVWNSFVWRVSPAGFLLRVKALPEKVDELDRSLGLSYPLLDAVMESHDEGGIRTTAVDNIIDSEAKCRVCGADLSLNLVVKCAKCSTLHHRDCWEFNGRCAVFACGSTKFRA